MVRSRFAAQMELLNTELIVMGTLCENALEHVMQALQEDNDALNREIIILGKRTEEKEREVENICINLLLKQQPVASDLRQISAALKMITDPRFPHAVPGSRLRGAARLNLAGITIQRFCSKWRQRRKRWSVPVWTLL